MSIQHESRMQAAFFQWMHYAHRAESKVCFAVPNGGRRDLREAISLKREGVRPGVPDVALCVPRGTKHGLFIEFKIKPNKPSALQQEMMLRLEEQGYQCAVCYDLDHAIAVVESYLQGDLNF